ncbi:MAG: cytochrome c [Bryobacteraceae bacterium]|nr:cytochrome c [Bryobacteraceae bacterium]MDW8380314.1 thiol-disulfide isomerase [Bryobacterales bacterium]
MRWWLFWLACRSVAGATFYQDVEPLLRKHCQRCHRPGEIGKMPLVTYAQVRPWAKAIREVVLRRRMPPWFAKSGSVKLANDPRLSDEEIAVIDTWVRQSAPAGQPGPATPQASSPPEEMWDIEWTMPRPIRVPARGELPYQFVILPEKIDHTRWVSAVEIRPGARSVVHHVVAYLREPQSEWLRDAPIGQPFSRPGVTTSDILAVYAPGQPPSVYPAGMAKRLPAGSELVLQLHYTPDGALHEDRTSIRLRWTTTPPRYEVLTLQIATTKFRIPAYERRYRVSAYGTMPNDALLLSFFPHLHRRGAAFEYALVQEGGRVDSLLLVEPYNFDWQLSYQLAQPLPLKKGTRLLCTAWYDNSPNNPRNPDPSVDVTYGEQSDQEMMVGFFDVAVPAGTTKQQFFVR